MTTEPTPTESRKLTGGAKFAVDMGPLFVFMIAYFWGRKLLPMIGGWFGETWCLKSGAEMFLAVGLFMPAFLIAFLYSVWREKRVAPGLLITGVIVGVLGSLTLILHNKTFFYMKPTIVYVLFASILATGLYTGRNYLKIVFDGALHMPDDAWLTLTKRYAIFFAALAIANEIAWRFLIKDCPVEPPVAATDATRPWGWLLTDCAIEPIAKCAGEAAWVKLKIFGFTAASFIFTAAQMPFILKHMPDDDEPASKG